MPRRTLTVLTLVFAAAVGIILYLGGLMNETQCAQLNGAIDYEGRVCIVRGIAHPLREAAIRHSAFWGVLVVFGALLIYGASLLFMGLRARMSREGAA